MYHAKAKGIGRCEVYSATKAFTAKTKMALESDLRKALVNQEFLLYYQPIIDLKTSKVAGFEALLRRSASRYRPPNTAISIGRATDSAVTAIVG